MVLGVEASAYKLEDQSDSGQSNPPSGSQNSQFLTGKKLPHRASLWELDPTSSLLWSSSATGTGGTGVTDPGADSSAAVDCEA